MGTHRRGSGTYVTGPKQLVRKPRRYGRNPPKNNGPFAADAAASGQKASLTATSQVEPCTSRVAFALDIDTGTPVMRTDYVFYADGAAIQVSCSWEVHSRTAHTPIEKPEEGPHTGAGVIARYDTIGVRIDAVSENVTSRRPTIAEADVLNIPKATNVFHIERTHLCGTTPIEFADIILPTDRYSMQYRFTIADGSKDPETL